MHQAIQTKYLYPTNHRGARVKAFASAGSLIVGWNDRVSIQKNHLAAAEALAIKLGWTGAWTGGWLPDELGAAFTQNSAGGGFTIAVGKLAA